MEDLISISEMAKLHGISRQTLIYYDEHDIFKPVRVEANGYRYYSRKQIPYLREICFLKNVGVGLSEIVEHMKSRDPEREIRLLVEQKKRLGEKISRLNQMRERINQRLGFYEEALDAKEMHTHLPFVKHFDRRKAVFREYIQPIERENLHLTLMEIWNEIVERDSIPSGAFGSTFKKESIEAGEPLVGAGSMVFIYPWSEDAANTIVFEGGEYACMYKRGMPYRTEELMELYEWIRANGYELIGDVADVCLLDTTFYHDEKDKDFCLLQAPVRKR